MWRLGHLGGSVLNLLLFLMLDGLHQSPGPEAPDKEFVSESVSEDDWL